MRDRIAAAAAEEDRAPHRKRGADRKTRRAVCREKRVRRGIHHAPRDRDGMLERGHRADPTEAQIAPVHDRSVELMPTFAIEHGAASRVEQRIILHDADGLLDRVERCAAVGQYLTADLQRLEGVLDLLSGDLGALTAQMASLESLPEVAKQQLDVALATDDRCRAAQA